MHILTLDGHLGAHLARHCQERVLEDVPVEVDLHLVTPEQSHSDDVGLRGRFGLDIELSPSVVAVVAGDD